MQWTKIKEQLKKNYNFQEWDTNYLSKAFYIPWGSKGREYTYSSSNSFDQQLALCRVFVTPSVVGVELYDQPYVATYDSFYDRTKVYQSTDKTRRFNPEWKALMREYKSAYGKEYPLSLKNVKLILKSIDKLNVEMPHCFEDVVIS